MRRLRFRQLILTSLCAGATLKQQRTVQHLREEALVLQGAGEKQGQSRAFWKGPGEKAGPPTAGLPTRGCMKALGAPSTSPAPGKPPPPPPRPVPHAGTGSRAAVQTDPSVPLHLAHRPPRPPQGPERQPHPPRHGDEPRPAGDCALPASSLTPEPGDGASGRDGGPGIPPSLPPGTSTEQRATRTGSQRDGDHEADPAPGLRRVQDAAQAKGRGRARSAGGRGSQRPRHGVGRGPLRTPQSRLHTREKRGPRAEG